MPMKRSSFYALDIHGRWKSRIKMAESTVVVFTPYFDHLLPKLLTAAPIEVDAITVVTDLSPQSGGAQNSKQLKAVLDLIERGVQVLTLDRLHAKVLIVDDAYVLAGSQNFTSFARKSKEATIDEPNDLSDTAFVARLREWEHEAEEVDPQLVRALLEALSDDVDELGRREASLVAAYEQVLADFERVKQAERAA